MSDTLEKSIACEVCEDKKANWKCSECDEFQCNQCRMVHVKSKATRGHDVKCIKKMPSVETEEKEQELKCKIHENEEFQRYCEDCKCLVCFECSVSEHSGHRLIKITDAVQKEKDFISSNIERVKSAQLPALKKDLTQLREIKRRYKREVEESVQEMRTQGDRMKRGVDNICEELEQEIQKQSKEDEQILDVLEKDLSKKIADVDILAQLAEEKITKASINSVFKMSEEVKQIFQKHQFINVPISLRPPKFMSKELDFNKIKNLFGYFEHDDFSSSDIDDSPPAVQETIVSSFEPSFSVGFLSAAGVNVWVANATGDIALVTKDGGIISTVQTTSANDIAANRNGDVFVAQSTSVRKINQDGSVSGFGRVQSYKVRGITITDNEDVLVTMIKHTNVKKLRVRRFSMAGKTVNTLDISSVNNPCSLKNPRYLTENVDTNIWIQDEENGNVFVVDNTGKHKFDYKGSGREESFCAEGLVHDRYGQVLIVDSDANAVHLVDKNGMFLQLILHNNGLDEPFGITLDTEDNIWVGTSNVFVVKYLK